MEGAFQSRRSKHLDFIALDLLCMQAAFALAYWATVRFGNPYALESYRFQLLVITASQAAVVLFTTGYSDVLRRGPFAEAVSVARLALATLVVALAVLFAVHLTAVASRMQFGFTFAFFAALSLARQLNKARIARFSPARRKSIVVVTSAALAPSAVAALGGAAGGAEFLVAGCVLLDATGCPELEREGVPCVAAGRGAARRVAAGWVDEVLIIQPDGMALPGQLLDGLLAMGVTVDWSPAAMSDGRWPATDVREVGGYKAVTSGMRIPTAGELAVKRAGDVAGGLLGCAATGVLFVFVAPAIKLSSPGPVFYSQERVGRNGRVFRMHKFRSMHVGADARKAELAGLNKVGGGMMFKVDGDPRIIGSERRRRDGSPGGVGNFIRRTSIDEFPQFFNVLKGEMSLVGTRPPTLDEWERYDLAHRARMSAKPGITGMWQVSGRSEITDFDEVVRLDREYIEGWSPLLDLKILLKTVAVVVRGRGAE